MSQFYFFHILNARQISPCFEPQKYIGAVLKIDSSAIYGCDYRTKPVKINLTKKKTFPTFKLIYMVELFLLGYMLLRVYVFAVFNISFCWHILLYVLVYKKVLLYMCSACIRKVNKKNQTSEY